MAQLVKLQDYISRYQIDLKRYPTQFVRLKKQQWERTQNEWKRGTFDSSWLENDHEEEVPEHKSLFYKLFKRSKEEHVEEDIGNDTELLDDELVPEESTTLHFQPNIIYNPQSREELKRIYLNQLFHFQLKWASSTLLEKSYVDPKFMRDTLLKMFTLQLPDNYFLFYYPILKLKNAPVELDIILVMPTEIVCLVVLEARDLDVFIGSSDRFWIQKSGMEEKKVLSPVIGLNRMESILHQILKKEEIELPVRKVILSRNGYIDYPGASYNTEFVDTRTFTNWFMTLKSSPSPMKHNQFKAAQAILNLVQTTSFSRAGWEIDSEDQND